jgi:hypothetical protein
MVFDNYYASSTNMIKNTWNVYKLSMSAPYAVIGKTSLPGGTNTKDKLLVLPAYLLLEGLYKITFSAIVTVVETGNNYSSNTDETYAKIFQPCTIASNLFKINILK